MNADTMEIVEQINILIDATLDAKMNPGSLSDSAKKIGREWALLLRMLSELEEKK